MTDRVIVLIDMDCFYCQVETRLNPSLAGKPLAVVQYNQWRGGGIIAVNYEARDKGVTRHMRGADAKEHCPEIILVTVPTIRDKADLTRYRDAGREVLTVFCRFSDCVQRASIDEAFIDITSVVEDRMKSLSQFEPSKWKSTFVVGYSTDGSNDEEERLKGLKSWLEDCESLHNTPSLRLAVGALIVEEMREAVLVETGFKCSAGIAHNKILAKLACGLHKPNRQTVLPQESVDILYKTLPVRKIKNLGGKFGNEIVEKLGCKTMSDLARYSEKELQTRYDEKNGSWLYNIARGYDFEPVEARLISKSIGCCKQFRGNLALKKSDDVYHWVTKLCEELSERLDEDEMMNKRRACLLTVSTSLGTDRTGKACSKSIALTSYSLEKLIQLAESSLKKMCQIDSAGNWSPPIKFLGLSAGKFSPITANKIDKFFKIADPSSERSLATTRQSTQVTVEGEEDSTLVKQNSLEPENSRMSFFEKVFAKDVSDSAQKLVLIPDLSMDDLFVDSDESQSSTTKFRHGKTSVSENKKSSVEGVKKQLFNDSNFSKTNVQVNGNSSKNKIESSINGKRKSNESGNKSIASFFSNQPITDSCIKLEELFPDINQVDDELLSILPKSYRNKILKMKEENVSIENGNNSRNSPSDNQSTLPDFSSNNYSTPVEVVDNNAASTAPSLECNFSYPSNSCVNVESFFKCDECGELVSDYEMHSDLHLAKKLHKELNSFSSKVLVKKDSISNEVGKKKKRPSSKSNDSNKKIRSIESFFAKK